MSQDSPVRPWAAPRAIGRDHESGILYEDERQQWLQQHPVVVPHTAKMSGNKNQRAFTDRGPSMAEGLRGIVERSAARRNGTAVNKNDVLTKPLPPIPQQVGLQSATTVAQDGVLQGSGREINKMSIYYVLDRSNMQGHHDKKSFAQRENSQPATEFGQKAAIDGPVHSSEKTKPNLLLRECKLQGYDDETPSIQPRAFEPALPPYSQQYYNMEVSYTNDPSDSPRLGHAAPSVEIPFAQLTPILHHTDYSETSWYEDSPTCHESSPDVQVPVAPNATPDPEIKQEYEPTEVGVTIDELLALMNQEKENERLENENHNPGSSYSAYRPAPPNSASVDICRADQRSGPGSQAPVSLIRNAESSLLVSPGAHCQVTPATPVWSPTPSPLSAYRVTPNQFSGSNAVSPLFVSPGSIHEDTSPPISPFCPIGCYSWSSDEPEPEINASPEPQFERERSASDVSMQEPVELPSSPPQAVTLQRVFTWRSDIPNGVDNGFVVPLEHMFARDYTTPDSPLLDSPLSSAPASPSPERRPSDLHGFSYDDEPRVGVYPSQFPHDHQLTHNFSSPYYDSSSPSSPRWLREERTGMDNVEESLVPQRLNVTKNNPTFVMNVPIHDVSQHQTAIHVSEPANGGHSRAASFDCNESYVNNTPINATPSRISQSPDVYSSESSEDSRGIKRKRFTKILFGKKGYLEDNEGPRNKKFRFIKEALEMGHSTIGNIKGMFWDDNRALIGSSKPSIVTENTAPITLNTDVQSILYAEIENMITHAANEFLMKEYYDGHLSTSSLLKVKRRWENKHMPGVPEFRFDQTTQCRLIRANRQHIKFGSTSNGLGPDTILRNWKKICKNMSIRTFVAPDSVIKKHIHDILGLLEILKADECHIELIMALNAHVHGELKKHEVMQQYRDTQNSGNSRS
ncbi:hypothetical protein PITC_082050 [Penicillium italicum]|uniref:Uncharacterized protein n=1 Tax=Penicillium italicum TaxID=40296 RepID=A0A0A2L8H3_PENIT|nr:hypothetical protein PITC_082050 [Penicillium italicum]